MTQESPEARFHAKLFDKIDDYIHSEDTPFENVKIEDQMPDGGRADIHITSYLTASLVIEMKRDDKYLLSRENISQAKRYANQVDAEFFALSNSNDFFLFKQQADQIAEFADLMTDYYYLDIRDLNVHHPTLDGFVPRILRAVQMLYSKGNLPQQQERDRVVGILKAFNQSVWPIYRALAEQKYEKDGAFTNHFDTWVAENDYARLSQNEQFDLVAKQHSYLLTNKVLFYEIVSSKTDWKREDPEIPTKNGRPLYRLSDGLDTIANNIEKHLQRQFTKIVEQIDYKPIFDDTDTLFDSFPDNPQTREAIYGLIDGMGARTLTEIDEDFLGELYEALIPESERKDLGQFYTPPKVAETIVKWAVPEKNEVTPRVLDPASGSGTFTVEIYKRLSELNPESSHQELINRILAVDINKFPLHLTALNLASKNIQTPTDEFHAINDSFFNVEPSMGRIDGTNLHSKNFDAVVGNPPYIKHKNLSPDKEHFRHHLKSYGENDNHPYYDGLNKLSGKTDAYLYFVTHALRFLRGGGRLGFIIPAKWLNVRYGEKFQTFLRDNCKIDAVVDFQTRVFEDAEVNTAMLLVEKCPDEKERNENVTDFIRVKESMSPQDLVNTIEFKRTIPEDSRLRFENRKGYSIVSVQQSTLDEQGSRKLGYYLRAPRPVIELLESDVFVSLSELAEVYRGVTSGAVDFFLLDEDDVEQWGLDNQFITPAIKSIKDVDTPVLPTDGVGLWILDVHEYVEKVRESNTEFEDRSLTEQVKDQLRQDGYESIYRYIDYGEKQEFNTRSTCKQRDVWFDLGELTPPDVLHPRFYNERIFTIRNTAGLVPSDAVQCVKTDEEVSEVLPVILNSTLYKIFLELWGRAEGGGVLQLLTYEVKSIPVPDCRKLSEEQKQQLIDSGASTDKEDSQVEIDEAVMDVFDIPLPVEDLQRLHSLLVQERIDKSSDSAVLVKEMSEFEDYDLSEFVSK
jgi:type I restriction-modification system DNA methylase subunit